MWTTALIMTPSPCPNSQVPLFVLSRLLSSLWVSHTGSASDWCALQEALYKCIDTIQYNCRFSIVLCQILSFEGGEVFKANIIVFNDATRGSNYSDMQCVDTKVALNTGCMKVVFLNKFVQDLLVSNK